MQNTQPKFKWHNEVIAWLNGETIEWKSAYDPEWTPTNQEINSNIPNFYTDGNHTYRIKPKEVIKYAGIFIDYEVTTMSGTEYDSLQDAIEHMKIRRANSGKFQKRTYLNGELIALELVKV